MNKYITSFSNIPDSDFVSEQYDCDTYTPTKSCLIILSTPRCGSTLLCNLLYANELCIAHEYFQEFQYLPILARRWDCYKGTTFKMEKYVDALRRYRTSKNGWLGINLHGHHLGTYIQGEPYLEDIPTYYIYIYRRDEIAQAVSYYLAASTGQWSSDFEPQRQASYDYRAIRKKLERIYRGKAAMRAFINTREISYTAIAYEDLRDNPGSELLRIPGMGTHDPTVTPTMSRLDRGPRESWRVRFSREHLADLAKRQPSFGGLAAPIRRIRELFR